MLIILESDVKTASALSRFLYRITKSANRRLSEMVENRSKIIDNPRSGVNAAWKRS